MKPFIFFLLLCPLLLPAQNKTHRFENDTLYTSCGYKIYEGQTLQIGKRPNTVTGFRFISKMTAEPASLENNSVVVRELSGYGYSPTGSAKIDVKASIVYRDSSKGFVLFTLAFDLAIGTRLPGSTCELVVPKEFLFTKEQALAMHKPFFEKDTLFTSCGYKIYEGQLLQFGEPTTITGRFRYISTVTPIAHSWLENKRILVDEIKSVNVGMLGDPNIHIVGAVEVKKKRTRFVEMYLIFDHAIENIPGIASELVVPEELRYKLKRDPEVEIERISVLYENKIITKEQFDAATKILAAQQKTL